MKKPHVFTLIALVALAGATTAWAAPPNPAAAASPRELRAPAPADDPMPGLAGDLGDNWLAADEAGAAGPDERRIVERRVVRDGGMGRGRMGMGPGGPGRHFGAILRQLDLRDPQKERLREIHERQARRDIQSRADLQLARLDLRKLMTADRPDPGAIDQQIDRMARMRADQAKQHVAAFLEARSLLTPEQLRKAKELHEQMGPGMGRGMRGHDMGDEGDRGPQ